MGGYYFTSEDLWKIKELLGVAIKRVADSKRGNPMLIQVPIEKGLEILSIGGKQVACGECGKALNAGIIEGELWVEPCPDCLSSEGEKAIEEYKADLAMEKTYQAVTDADIKACAMREVG